MPEVVVNCDDAGRMQACPICSAPVSRAVFADHVQGCISPCSSADEWEQTDSPDTPSLAMPNPSHNLNDDQARHNNLNNSTSSNHGLRRRPRVLLLNGDDIKYNASKNQNELELEANTEMRVRKQSGKPGKRRTAPGKRASGKVGGGSNGKNLFAALKPEASPDDALARINDARQSPVESPAEVDAISLPPASAAATPADDEPTSDSCASDEAGDSPVSKTSSASAGLDHGVDDDEEEEHEVVPELYVHVRRMSRGHGIVRAPGAPPRSSSLSVRFDSHPPHVYRSQFTSNTRAVTLPAGIQLPQGEQEAGLNLAKHVHQSSVTKTGRHERGLGRIAFGFTQFCSRDGTATLRVPGHRSKYTQCHGASATDHQWSGIPPRGGPSGVRKCDMGSERAMCFTEAPAAQRQRVWRLSRWGPSEPERYPVPKSRRGRRRTRKSHDDEQQPPAPAPSRTFWPHITVIDTSLLTVGK
ncbi:uncharacterized protein MONBRDRAFT_37843 [Monosiga brevicollis MX1]|uniref:Uncharacterized protein n=1 Tax=Monosiga brevicollis TaxID=81824 RepID=A9V474_MONBE|nr:uncharacterized protein MONBRDRAFT_37843 [Monosiga brevicollis MX1]EDQ87569.1 predicted protein [Monosiga brevicollis MX1]|eukprot:XP_001747489.1 hypothetical protein [Monosiga brevicollis MX1]